MEVFSNLKRTGVVPVVVLEHSENALPTAKAMLAGGIDTMEITFRTSAAEASIAAVSAQCPEMLVGAGTVLTLVQCQRAVDAGARFVVLPGFDRGIVAWCVEHDVAVVPGCVTPTEIMEALSFGLNVVKFFPADVYGGLRAMKALHAPFGGVRFLPTGGVNAQNLAEYLSTPFVLAVGGSWICPKAEIEAGNFEAITTLCSAAHAIKETVL